MTARWVWPFRYDPTPAGGWTVTCRSCGTTSNAPYAVRSAARDWANNHTCPPPDDPKDAA